ncbi:MAG: HD domain-containing protein [Patescibacteria group bacterium]|nr:HD domain-containing protein [Patescibacteria group bacterium]
MVKKFGSDPYRLLPHVPEVERWARYVLEKYPEADEEIVFLSVWLHDLGHYPIPTKIDHAIRSEERSKSFLEKQNYPKDKTDKVLHCVRSHRCRDVMPNSLEAKIIACIDSASHMTEPMYLDMARDDKKSKREFRAYAKMDRDYRDLGIFPEIQSELKDLYESWKDLIKVYEKIDLD